MAKNKQTPGPTSTAPKPAGGKGKKPPTRPVLYPELRAEVYVTGSPLGPITVEQAKDWLGWEEETDEIKFGDDYLFVAPNGRKVRCANNLHNRPYNDAWATTLSQEHLNRHFAPKGPNGEAVVIGKTGLILSAQHRLIGLVIAEMRRTSEAEKYHWEDKWDGPVTMSSIVVFGVDESSETTRTLDNVRPRTLGDVLYSDEMFAASKAGERKVLCRMLDYAVRYLWHRTGHDKDAFSPRRTHSESLDFIGRHPRVKRAVSHVHTEDGGAARKISRVVSPGTAAGMLYLMGAHDSDYDTYHDEGKGYSEKRINWDQWDKATDFWTLLAGSPDFDDVIRALTDQAAVGNGGLEDRTALLAKAWAAFLDDEPLTYGAVMPEYVPGEDGTTVLNEHPSFGGIDNGLPEDDDDTPTPTPAEVEAAKAAIRSANGDGTHAPADEEDDDFGFGGGEDSADSALPAETNDGPAAAPQPVRKRPIARKPS